ncbi:hypothetical protein ABZ656_16425 [Streptomyces sp. NPDC007095]
MRRTEYDAGQAAKRRTVPAATFWWARYAGLVEDPMTDCEQQRRRNEDR